MFNRWVFKESKEPRTGWSVGLVNKMDKQIMYIENKSDGLNGPARIGWVTRSKSGKSIYYHDKRFESLKGNGFKANYLDVETRNEYWISGCKKKGGDRLYPGTIEIDMDAAKEYWHSIRNLPERENETVIKCSGKYKK